MQQEHTNISIYGHSFVRRLSEFVSGDYARHNFGLDPAKYRVNCYGIGGLTLHHPRLHAFDDIL